jgi:hypothetical protein
LTLPLHVCPRTVITFIVLEHQVCPAYPSLCHFRSNQRGIGRFPVRLIVTSLPLDAFIISPDWPSHFVRPLSLANSEVSLILPINNSITQQHYLQNRRAGYPDRHFRRSTSRASSSSRSAHPVLCRRTVRKTLQLTHSIYRSYPRCYCCIA